MKSLFILALGSLCCFAGGRFSDATQDRIIVQPLGRFSATNLAVARRGLEQMFSAPVEVRPTVALPRSAYYAPRRRYRADALLRFLRPHIRGEHVIGLTSVDISTTKGAIKDWGVLGLGSPPERVCVVSTFRMGSGKVGRPLFLARLSNVEDHELGHAYGLPHCPNPHCLMADANGVIRTVDSSSGKFCAACREKLRGHLRSQPTKGRARSPTMTKR